MATEEHLMLSNTIKNIHKELRENTKELGKEIAWQQHLQNNQKLLLYSDSMNKLATKIWEQNNKNQQSIKNTNDKSKINNTRITWSIDYCLKYYFTEKLYLIQRQREQIILKQIFDIDHQHTTITKLPTKLCSTIEKPIKLKLLDVGSCYNPFLLYSDKFDVLAIDIAPANKTVYKCDFLNVELIENCTENVESNDTMKMFEHSTNPITKLLKCSYNIIIFSLLLEYLPTSDQRIDCCRRAYNLLTVEGILIVITPDSKHLGANVKLMKTWRYTLSLIGFNRIKYEKLEHITCMVFRKAIDKRLTLRWADIHKENYMKYEIKIPQDFTELNNNTNNNDNDNAEDFNDNDFNKLVPELCIDKTRNLFLELPLS